MITKSYAETGIFINTSTARRLVIDTKYIKEENTYLKEENSILNNQKIELQTVVSKSEKQIEYLNLNLKNSNWQRDEYKNLLEECSEKVANQPSRATWFAAGSLATLIVFILGFMFVSK